MAKELDLSAFDQIRPVLEQIDVGTKICLCVNIQSELYRNNDSGWSIYLTESQNRAIKISGTFPMALPYGALYEVEGVVSEYKNDRQLKVAKYAVVEAESEETIVKRLSSIEELNTHAYQVYSRYGQRILHDICEAPERVSKTLNIPIERVLSWKSHLKRNEVIEEAFHWLIDLGISAKAAKELLDTHGEMVVETIKQDPYFLMDELENYSFIKADSIARKMNHPIDSESRIRHAILYILTQACYQKGHCYLSVEKLQTGLRKLIDQKLSYPESQKLLSSYPDLEQLPVERGTIQTTVDRNKLIHAMEAWQQTDKKEAFAFYFHQISNQAIDRAMGILLSGNQLIRSTTESGEVCFALGYVARAEEILAKTILNLSQAEYDHFPDNEMVLNAVCAKEGIALEAKQREAALRFSQAKGGIFILNGAAGCGKTFVLNIILKTLQELYQKRHKSFDVSVLAPTGKAAQVAQASTGLEAYTIHRKLGYIRQDNETFGTGMFHEDCLVIDEMSMVDVLLASELFSHIGGGTKVIVMGDTEQLPSIGPGAVLKDMINSHSVETVTLDVVKRQEGDSGILANAQRILAGEPLENLVRGQSGDAYVMERPKVLAARTRIMKLYQQTVQKHGLEQVQVLCPQKKTQIGVDVMNYCLQQVVNPDKSGEAKIQVGEVMIRTEDYQEFKRALCFKKGDKVIHTKNNYKMPWYDLTKNAGLLMNPTKQGIINGEMGVIVQIIAAAGSDKKKHPRIVVRYDNGYVIYEDDFSELSHAYAITIHKAQGSQWPVVLSPISNVNHMMLNRNILYTLYTRAQKLSFVVGERDAMDYAVQNKGMTERNTRLKQLIVPSPSLF